MWRGPCVCFCFVLFVCFFVQFSRFFWPFFELLFLFFKLQMYFGCATSPIFSYGLSLRDADKWEPFGVHFFFQEKVAIDRVKLLKKLGPKRLEDLEGKSAGLFLVVSTPCCFGLPVWGKRFGFSCFFLIWRGRKQHKWFCASKALADMNDEILVG